MKKLIISLLLVSVLLGTAGVVNAGFWSSVFGSVNKDKPNTEAINTYVQEQNKTEENQRVLDKNQPLPKVENSLERANLIERLNRFNSSEKISYIYLLSFGKVMAFYTIKGKVSSVNSYLSTPTQIITKKGKPCNNFDDYSARDCYVVESPDTDGSYGTNGEAIFFFTTENAYVEWNGEYLLADQPLKLTTQPELIRVIQ